ncbi:hypothetical protein RCS94_02635 [Orbaceae bacterium ac157xtp]
MGARKMQQMGKLCYGWRFAGHVAQATCLTNRSAELGTLEAE